MTGKENSKENSDYIYSNIQSPISERDSDCTHTCLCWSISFELLSCLSDAERLGRSPGNEGAPERPQTASETSRQSSPDAVITVETEVSVSDENMTRMENLLDLWSDNLKVDISLMYDVDKIMKINNECYLLLLACYLYPPKYLFAFYSI